MRRRVFFASALTAASTTVAGCGFAESRTEHTDPTVTTDTNPRDNGKYLEFHDDGVELATVGVDPKLAPLPSTLLTSISHRENTELQSLTQRFAAPDSDGTAPQLSLRTASNRNDVPAPPIALSQDGIAAVVDVDQFDELANETVFIPLTVTRWPESARRLVVENTVELVKTEAPDHTHVLTGKFEFEFTTDTGTDEGTTETSDSLR